MTTETKVEPPPDAKITTICASYGNDPHRMLDILLAVQEARRCVTASSMDTIAEAVGLTRRR